MSTNDSMAAAELDIDSFQQQVFANIEVLLHPLPEIKRSGKVSRKDQAALARLLEQDLGREQAQTEAARIAALGSAPAPTVVIINKRIEQISEASSQANKLVKKKGIMKYLCPALQSISDDAFEIAKVTTPILVTLSLAGTLTIPVDPLVVACIAVVISRMGIASLCVDSNDSSDKDK